MSSEAEALRGAIDGLELANDGSWVLLGWAHDGADPDRVLEVEVTEATTVLGIGRAETYRDDLKRAGIGDGFAGLRIPLRTRPRGESPGILRGLIGWRRGRSSRAGAECRLSLRRATDGTVIVGPTPVRMSTILGHLDFLAEGMAGGWAVDLAHRGTPLEIEMIVDGQPADRVIADGRREDLTARYGVEDSGGFRWVLPPALADGQPHQISARVAHTPILLPSCAGEITVSPDDLLAGPGLRPLPTALANRKRYQSYIDDYYRAARLAIEAAAADCAIYGGYAIHEFETFLACQFDHAYVGSSDAVLARPRSPGDTERTTLYILHLDIAGFAKYCLSGMTDGFFRSRAEARQPTIVLVEAPDASGGLRDLDSSRAKEWCNVAMRMARAEGMHPSLANTLLDYFRGHPGFVLSLLAQSSAAVRDE